jgi:hypothetical protein
VARGDAAIDPGVARRIEARANCGERFAVEDARNADQHVVSNAPRKTQSL